MFRIRYYLVFVFTVIFYLNSLAFAKNIDLIVINRKGASRKYTDTRPVLFPHALHEKRNKCDECHPKIFTAKIGANDINMQGNTEGKFCGACHNARIAWSLLYCDRCHSGDTSSENPLYRKEE